MNCQNCNTHNDDHARKCGLCRRNLKSVKTAQNHTVLRKVLKHRTSGFPFFDYQ